MISNLLNVALIGAPGLPELVVIALIILLLFGGSKLPALMRNLGRSTNEFKRGMSDTVAEDDRSASEDEKN
ncbi:twin-arginine translocase TatA/TatE family subunit [bacterium]|nr:twin-arginine translocase TatA/TatE family subunit [bacterium]